MPPVSIRDEARSDIAEAAGWYEGESRGLGREFTRAVRASLAAIGRHPEHYPRVFEDVRRALLRRFPYAVYFLVEPAAVVVVACVHARRDPQVWQSRR